MAQSARPAAILRWAVDGCLEWQRVGLSPPAMVLDATDGRTSSSPSTRRENSPCFHKIRRLFRPCFAMNLILSACLSAHVRCTFQGSKTSI